MGNPLKEDAMMEAFYNASIQMSSAKESLFSSGLTHGS
jgi:hypothetical protein